MARIYVTLIASLLITQAAPAAIYTGTVTVESNADLSDVNAGNYQYTNQISAATLPDFNFAFSTLGDTDFSVTWQAPTNYLIQITPPSGFDFVQVLFNFYTGNSYYNVGEVIPPATVSLTDFSGNNLPNMPPSTQFTGPQTATFPANNAGAFIIPTNLPLGESFYLSSATVEFTVPAAYNVDFNAPILGFEVYGQAFSNQPNPNLAPANPGQWITLVQVPEPSSLILLSVAGLGVIARRRRKR
jgi:hypothetical protein